MAEIDKLTVGVSFSVDEKTAQVCLKIVEIYVNQTGADIIGHKEDDGSITYEPKYQNGHEGKEHERIPFPEMAGEQRTEKSQIENHHV